MNRLRLAAFFVFAVLCAGAFSLPAAAQGEGSAPDANKARVLVLPFQVNAGQKVAAMGRELPTLISQRLLSRKIEVVPTSQAEKFLNGRDAASIDEAIARSLALEAGATHAVFGSLSEAGDMLSLDARLIEVRGSMNVPLYAEQRGARSLSAVADSVSGKIAADLKNQRTISGVDVRGLKVLDPDVVLMRLSMKQGDPVDATLINNEFKRIWDLGYFSDVSAELEGNPANPLLVFNVVEKPRISAISVTGTSELDDDDVLAAVSSKSGSILNEKILADDIQKITELYRKEGFYLAKVGYRVEERDRGARLIFEIEEGNKLYIKSVVINGAERIDEDDIKKELGLKERGLFSFITGDGVLKEELRDRDTAAISLYYLNRGFLDVAVSAPEIDYEDDGIVVTFTVQEGKPYRVGEVRFEGELIDSDATLRSLVDMERLAGENEFFRLETMQDDMKKLTDFYSDYGYAFADADGRPMPVPGSDPDSEEGVVDVVYYMTKKNRIYVRSVIIDGTYRTRNNVVLREMRLIDGDLFSGSALRRSSERLQNLGYFDTVDISIVPTDNPEEVDLKVNLKETNSGAITLGVGYSSYSKVGFGGSIMERNLFGKGYGLGFSGSFSSRDTIYSLQFVNPRVYDSDLSFGIDSYVMDEEYDDFSKKTVGATFNFAYPIGEYSSVGWGYRIDHYKLYEVQDYATQTIKDYEGNNLSSVVHTYLRRSTIDNIMRPSRGTFAQIGMEYGGTFLGGSDDFIKLTGEFGYYHQLRRFHVLHFKTEVGAVLKNSSHIVPVFERFYLGGINSVRGYSMSDMSPRDPRTDEEIGGDRMGYVNLEYIYTFQPELGLAVVPFVDAGFNLDTDNSRYSFSDASGVSAGLELRWNSPIGDLRFAYGFPLKKVYGDKRTSGRFEFTMGQGF